MTASALLRHGPAYAATLLDGLTDWMTRRGYSEVGQLRGLLAISPDLDESAYERIGYVTTLQEAKQTYGYWWRRRR
jgi:dihydroorotate dehydrogenase (fumarate)